MTPEKNHPTPNFTLNLSRTELKTLDSPTPDRKIWIPNPPQTQKIPNKEIKKPSKQSEIVENLVQNPKKSRSKSENSHEKTKTA